MEDRLARAARAVRDMGVAAGEGGGGGDVLVVVGCALDSDGAPPPPATPPSAVAGAVTDAPAPTEFPPDFIRIVPCAR
jgi:hypothetical protein